MENLNFLNFGGNSILAIQIVSEFEKVVASSDFSTDLMKFLLSEDFSLKTCNEWIEKNVLKSKNYKRQLSDKGEVKTDKSAKYLKFDTQYRLIEKWKYEMIACVDATPILIDYCK